MLPIVKIENDRGEVLDFSASPRYVAMLTGTGPPAATINRAKVSVADGTRYNSATVGERELLLTIYILRDIARARLNLYRFIATKSHVKIYYQADGLEVYIEGYVETAEVNPWEENQNVQVSIICPMPFWQDVASTYTDASQVSRLFEFPFYTDESKNLLRYPYRQTTTTFNGITFTDNGDGSVTVNGTATADVYFILDFTSENLAPGQEYIASIGETHHDKFWMCLDYFKSDGSYSNMKGVYAVSTFTAPSDYAGTRAFLVVEGGGIVDNVTVYPMIRHASIEDGTYEPYAEAGIELSTADQASSTLIENGGTVETGVTFVITATVRSTNPRVHNLSTGEYIGVHAALEPGDQLEICTVTGSKRVTHVRNGVRTNYINTVMVGSSWLQMVVGANEYSYTVDTGECELGVYHTNMYTGV